MSTVDAGNGASFAEDQGFASIVDRRARARTAKARLSVSTVAFDLCARTVVERRFANMEG